VWLPVISKPRLSPTGKTTNQAEVCRALKLWSN
jgi:hypothetical protein